jgi:hypothetical protein
MVVFCCEWRIEPDINTTVVNLLLALVKQNMGIVEVARRQETAIE